MTSPELIAFLRGRLSGAAMPSELELDESLWRVMDELWQRSVRHIAQRRVSEWGGVLVLDEQDNLKLVNAVEGTAERVPLQIPAGEVFVGSFHTHPYADGTTGIAFSGADIADAIDSGELLSVVQSGREIFALIRTEVTRSRVDRAQLKHEHGALHRYYLSQGMSDEGAVYYADLDICEAYGLALYVGLAFGALWEAYRP